MGKLWILIGWVLVLTGCAAPGQYDANRIRFSEESLARPEYNRDFIACDRIASSNKASILGNAAGTAAIGAGIGAMTGAIMGFGTGKLAALGAATGGVSGAAGAYAYNQNDYRSTMIQCMRDRGYQAY